MSRSGVWLPAAAALSVLVSGCSGGGGGGGGGGGNVNDVATAPAPPPAATPPQGYAVLNAAAAANYRSTGEFSGVDLSAASENSFRTNAGLSPLCQGSGNANCASASTYALQNLHFAHTATLADGSNVTGKGKLIAIVDNGYRLSHQELSGKSVQRFLGTTAALPVDDHGTSVAAVAAGKRDGNGMMGVAPDAALHLSSWSAPSSRDFLAHLAGATNHARSLGAVVQNNSWGWLDEVDATTERQNYARSGKASYAAYLPSSPLGGSERQWSTLFKAYDDFQKTGVVVYSNSNNEALPDVDAWAALPLFVPELGEAWIVASNALFSVDRSNGRILDADLLSAPCGVAARFCLTTDGTVRAPNAGGDATYGLVTGTSFAAPQISGHIALLAQAFPDLSPAEWTTRLLATAQTGWDGFQDTISGQATYGSGVVKKYSSLYGHGVPDIKAALSPVGGLSIASGRNVHSAALTPIASGVSTSGAVVGDAIAEALAGREIMVVDQLGTDFRIKGEELQQPQPSSERFATVGGAPHLAAQAAQLGYSFDASASFAPVHESVEETAMAKLMFSQSFGAAEGETLFSNVMTIEEGTFFQFSGQVLDGGLDGDATSMTMSRFTRRDGITIEHSLSFGHSFDRFFGSQAVGPFMAADHSSNVSSGYSVTVPLDLDWSLTGFAELGGGHVVEDAQSLVDFGAMAFGSGGLMAHRQELFAAGDRLSFYAGVRPTMVAGSATMRLPVGRSADGTIRYDSVGVDLMDGDLPLRAGASYAARMSGGFDMLLNFNSDLTTSRPGDMALSLSGGLRKVF